VQLEVQLGSHFVGSPAYRSAGKYGAPRHGAMRICTGLQNRRRAMTTALDYTALAQLHRPSDPPALRAECRRFLATGLKPRDVAVALRIDLALVLEPLATPSPPSSAAAAPLSVRRLAAGGVGRSFPDFPNSR